MSLTYIPYITFDILNQQLTLVVLLDYKINNPSRINLIKKIVLKSQ